MQEMGSARLFRKVCVIAGVVSLSTAGGLTAADAGDSGPLGPGTITYDVRPLPAGLGEFKVVAVPGQVVNGVCEHSLPTQDRAGGGPLIVQQVAYNPATCTDLIREGRGPGPGAAGTTSAALYGAASSGVPCNGHNEIHTAWFDPLGIEVSAVTTCISNPSTCSSGDIRQWFEPSGWIESSHTLGGSYDGNWCYGYSFEHMHNTPFCGGTDIYYDPSTYGQDAGGDESGNPNTRVTGCDANLLHYTWELDPGP
jgi:hypothetical protein